MLSSAHTPPIGPVEIGGFFPSSCGRILSPLTVISSERESTVQEALVFLENYFLGDIGPPPLPSPKTFMFLGVAGGTIEIPRGGGGGPRSGTAAAPVGSTRPSDPMRIGRRSFIRRAVLRAMVALLFD